MTQQEKFRGLLARIESEAEEEIKNIESSFEKKKKELEEEFEKKKKSHIEREKDNYRRQGELEKTKMISAARLQSRKEILRCKRKIIENVFDRALEKIQDVDKKNFRKLIRKLLEKMVSTGKESIIPAGKSDVFTESFIKKINSEKAWNLKLENTDEDIEGWFVLEGENYSALASAPALKENLKELYESRVAKKLFAEK